MSTKPRPPVVSTGRAIVVTVRFVVASVFILALVWRVLGAPSLCIYCNTSLNGRIPWTIAVGQGRKFRADTSLWEFANSVELTLITAPASNSAHLFCLL
jgi:hypothetical protein